MEFKNNYNLHASIMTYDDLLDKGKILGTFIEEMVEIIFKPFGAYAYIIAEGERIRGDVKDFYNSWSKIKDKLENGKVFKLDLTAEIRPIGTKWEEAGEYKYTDRYASISIRSNKNPLRHKYASYIQFSIRRLMYNDGIIPNEMQDIFIKRVELLLKCIENTGSVVTLDGMGRFSVESAHERHLNFNAASASSDYDKYFRGYFWGNFISANHVKILGGIDEIRKKAPVYLVKELDNGGAYLQLTEDINNFNDEELKNLKQYFQDILPKFNKFYPEMENKNICGMRFVAD